MLLHIILDFTAFKFEKLSNVSVVSNQVSIGMEGFTGHALVAIFINCSTVKKSKCRR